MVECIMQNYRRFCHNYVAAVNLNDMSTLSNNNVECVHTYESSGCISASRQMIRISEDMPTLEELLNC